MGSVEHSLVLLISWKILQERERGGCQSRFRDVVAIVNSLEQELRDLVVLFNRDRVEYALCGGMAVALHGYPRFTNGIDFLIPQESLEKARKAAEMLGFLDESGRIPFPDSDVYRILKIEGSDIRILDLLVPKSLETTAWKHREWFDWNGVPLCTVSVEGLVEMKLAAGRDQDLLDIKQLGFARDHEQSE